MANYYNEINRLLDKLVHKGLVHIREDFKLGAKGGIFTFWELHILRRLAISGEQRVSELIEEVQVNKSLISSMIIKLVTGGYIIKTQSSEDGRVYFLKLTELGVEVVEKSHQLQKELLDFVLEDVTLNEERAILKFLSKINQLTMTNNSRK